MLNQQIREQEKNTCGATEYKHVIVCYGSRPMWAVNTTVSIYIHHKCQIA